MTFQAPSSDITAVRPRIFLARMKEQGDPQGALAHYNEALLRSPRPAEARFGLGNHPPHSDRPTREAYDLVKEFLKG